LIEIAVRRSPTIRKSTSARKTSRVVARGRWGKSVSLGLLDSGPTSPVDKRRKIIAFSDFA
jgi:hypothetical protein